VIRAKKAVLVVAMTAALVIGSGAAAGAVCMPMKATPPASGSGVLK
jgi:hypothetical protein